MRRRARGALVTALLWSVAWALASIPLVVVPVYDRLPFHDPVHSARQIWEIARFALRNYAVLGALAGVVYALVLARASRGARSVHDLSMPRTATWGALGGLVLPLVALLIVLAGGAPIQGYVADLLLMLAGSTAVGAGLAAGMLAIARRAPERLPSAAAAPMLAPPDA